MSGLKKSCVSLNPPVLIAGFTSRAYASRFSNSENFQIISLLKQNFEFVHGFDLFTFLSGCSGGFLLTGKNYDLRYTL